MKVKRDKKDAADVDMSAFSDIAFLLIIFFILTTTFVKPFGSDLSVPSGSSDPENKTEDKQLTILLKGSSIRYADNDDELSINELRKKLLAENFPNKEPDKRMVIVECDKDLPYEQYFQVVMAISKAGGVLALIEEENNK